MSGCAPNQGRFADRFDLIALLIAPVDVVLERVRARTTSPFGHTADHHAMIAADTTMFEPLSRMRAALGNDTPTAPGDDVSECYRGLVREGRGYPTLGVDA